MLDNAFPQCFTKQLCNFYIWYFQLKEAYVHLQAHQIVLLECVRLLMKP